MHATSSDWKEAEACIDATRDVLHRGELLTRILPDFRRLFRADLAVWNTHAPDGTLTDYLFEPEIDVGHLLAPFLQFYCEHPFHAHLCQTLRNGHVGCLSDRMSIRTLLRTGLWNEVYVHLHAKHQLFIGGRLDSSSVFGLGVNRLGRDFGPRERELARFVRPKFETLIQSIIRREQTQHLAQLLCRFFTQSGGTMIAIAPNGKTLDPAQALNLAGADESPAPENRSLLAAISAVLKHLKGAIAEGRKFLCIQVHDLDCLVLSLGKNVGWLLFAEPANNRKSGQRHQASLTRRETEVLHWLGAGKTNREIGVLCGISPRTVGRHCENLFAKLGVESRHAAALLARDLEH